MGRRGEEGRTADCWVGGTVWHRGTLIWFLVERVGGGGEEKLANKYVPVAESSVLVCGNDESLPVGEVKKEVGEQEAVCLSFDVVETQVKAKPGRRRA